MWHFNNICSHNKLLQSTNFQYHYFTVSFTQTRERIGCCNGTKIVRPSCESFTYWQSEKFGLWIVKCFMCGPLVDVNVGVCCRWAVGTFCCHIERLFCGILDINCVCTGVCVCGCVLGWVHSHTWPVIIGFCFSCIKFSCTYSDLMLSANLVN